MDLRNEPPHPRVEAAPSGKRLPARQVWERYGVSSRTLDRWLADPGLNFPRPLVINNRRYWDEFDLVAFERARASKVA